jgi:chemotaxis protein CheD
MSTCIAETVTRTSVGMSEIAVARAPGKLTSVLGSCIGIVLYHPRLRIGALAHVVVADSDGRIGPPGKFADTAVPEMIRLLQQQGAFPGGLTARIVGGANMFGHGPMKIGENNTVAVTAALAKARQFVVAQHIGGEKGRRVSLDCATGNLTIEIGGMPPVVI